MYVGCFRPRSGLALRDRRDRATFPAYRKSSIPCTVVLDYARNRNVGINHFLGEAS